MPASSSQSPLGPIQISPNRRYFVDHYGTPFFWLGDTQWELFCAFSIADALAILQTRAHQGFSVIQVMLTGVGDGTKPNFDGHTPWNDGNPDSPNEQFFARVDEIVGLAAGAGMILVVGVYHQLQASRITQDNARDYARWVALRYRHAENLVWSMYPKAEPEFIPVVRELAAGLQEGDAGTHLITVHPDPSPASSSFIHTESWLSFNSIQTWAYTHLIIPMVSHDYSLEPPKPVVMAEGAYEAGEEYGFEVTPLWVRRQAYWTYLAGGHHTYGHNDCWRVRPSWMNALHTPGASQLGLLRHLLTTKPAWWDLAPAPSLVAKTLAGDPSLNASAWSQSGSWGLVYLGAPAIVAVDLGMPAASGPVRATWIYPAIGTITPIGDVSPACTHTFCTPDSWEDALLLLEVVS